MFLNASEYMKIVDFEQFKRLLKNISLYGFDPKAHNLILLDENDNMIKDEEKLREKMLENFYFYLGIDGQQSVSS